MAPELSVSLHLSLLSSQTARVAIFSCLVAIARPIVGHYSPINILLDILLETLLSITNHNFQLLVESSYRWSFFWGWRSKSTLSIACLLCLTIVLRHNPHCVSFTLCKGRSERVYYGNFLTHIKKKNLQNKHMSTAIIFCQSFEPYSPIPLFFARDIIWDHV